jgi:hypothetical protein
VRILGRVGAWRPPTQDELEKAILGAMEIEEKTREEIIALLEAGKSVRWCKSSNFYYDHSYGKIGTPRQKQPPKMAMCDCGHEVEVGQRMSASLGTSCPDCYDRMSD